MNEKDEQMFQVAVQAVNALLERSDTQWDRDARRCAAALIAKGLRTDDVANAAAIIANRLEEIRKERKDAAANAN